MGASYLLRVRQLANPSDRKSPFPGLLQSPLPDSNRMERLRQPVAAGGNGFGLFCRFLARGICE
jgi:hypothetical protein